MADNRVLAAAFGVLIVAWALRSHTAGFFIGMPAPSLWIGFVATVLVLIFTPAVMIKARWTVTGAVIVGVINIIMHIFAVNLMPMGKVYGPAVSLILAVLFTYFSFRAYLEK